MCVSVRVCICVCARYHYRALLDFVEGNESGEEVNISGPKVDDIEFYFPEFQEFCFM